ncbi:MAG: hypothetical protein N2Z22_11125 [Turneriella sp.]|nr:hypothetical protein [Turneriella sp.]
MPYFYHLIAIFAIVALGCSSAPKKSPYLKYLEVRTSEIPGAGDGVFATAPIPAGVDLGGYEGRYITEAEWLDLVNRDQWHYVMSLPECAYPHTHPYKLIDGRGGSIHSKINYAPPPFQNVEIAFFCEPPYARIVTKRAIEAGEELLMDYGPDYNYYFMKDPKVQQYFREKEAKLKKSKKQAAR